MKQRIDYWEDFSNYKPKSLKSQLEQLIKDLRKNAKKRAEYRQFDYADIYRNLAYKLEKLI